MTDDFFRNRLDQMIDLRHPLAVLANRMPWQEIEASLAQRWARQVKAGTWQYFSGNEYFEHQWPCDPTQLGRFRKALGEEGVEELLARTMEVAVTLKLIAKKELTRVIVDSTVQEKAVAHPTDSKLLETARSKVVEAAKAEGIELKQTYAKEGQLLGYKAGRYAVLCAAGYNIRWLLRMIVKKGLSLLLCLLQASGLTGLFTKLAEIFGLTRLQNSDQRWALA